LIGDAAPKPALGDGHYFQMYRANEVWHWQIGNTEPTLPMYWNAVGYQANAGLESYLNLGVTDYLTHDSMNVALSEAAWRTSAGPRAQRRPSSECARGCARWRVAPCGVDRLGVRVGR
jgi:hypothetical protein